MTSERHNLLSSTSSLGQKRSWLEYFAAEQPRLDQKQPTGNICKVQTKIWQGAVPAAFPQILSQHREQHSKQGTQSVICSLGSFSPAAHPVVYSFYTQAKTETQVSLSIIQSPTRAVTMEGLGRKREISPLTSPKTTCFPSSQGVSFRVMKNCKRCKI